MHSNVSLLIIRRQYNVKWLDIFSWIYYCFTLHRDRFLYIQMIFLKNTSKPVTGVKMNKQNEVWTIYSMKHMIKLTCIVPAHQGSTACARRAWSHTWDCRRCESSSPQHTAAPHGSSPTCAPLSPLETHEECDYTIPLCKLAFDLLGPASFRHK